MRDDKETGVEGNGAQLQPFMAIRLNHYTRLRFYMKNGLDPNLRDGRKRTMLICACELPDQQTALKYVDFLLKQGARIGNTDCNGRNALHVAVQHGHARIVERLLQFAAGDYDVNAKERMHGNTALMCAVLNKDLDITRQLVKVLRHYDLTVDIPDNRDITPLIQATISGLVDIARCLIVVGKASEHHRDKYFQNTASEWKHASERGQLPYNPKNIPSIHCCPACTPTRTSANSAGTSTTWVHVYPSISQKRECAESTNCVTKSAGMLSSKACRWPDVKRVYDLYEKELAGSYRKGVPPRPKTPPSLEVSPSKGRGDALWGKTARTLRMRERRHTIALTQSLPNSISTRSLFARRSVPNRTLGRRSSMIAVSDDEGSKWLMEKRSNLTRRQSDSQVPATAPAEIDTSPFTTAGGQMIKRRHSVGFQSLTITHDLALGSLQSPGRVPRRSSLRRRESMKETSQPILEQDEDAETGEMDD